MLALLVVIACSLMVGQADASWRDQVGPTNTPTPTPTPFSPAPFYPTPTPTPVVPVFATDETKALSALCWVECRGMKEQRAACCSSVVDTVMTRIERGKMTDGTVIGTIRYRCGPDTIACHFPAYTTRGCLGISSPCPFYDKTGMDFFGGVVTRYDKGWLRPRCAGYLYYGLQPFDRPECRIEATNGQWQNFHNGV